MSVGGTDDVVYTSAAVVASIATDRGRHTYGLQGRSFGRRQTRE